MRIAQVTPGPEHRALAEELGRRGHAAQPFGGADAALAAFARIDEFDLVHLHVDAVRLPLVARQSTPAVVTVYDVIDPDQAQECHRRFRHVAFVAASDDLRRAMPWMHWHATIAEDDAGAYLPIYEQLRAERAAEHPPRRAATGH